MGSTIKNILVDTSTLGAPVLLQLVVQAVTYSDYEHNCHDSSMALWPIQDSNSPQPDSVMGVGRETGTTDLPLGELICKE